MSTELAKTYEPAAVEAEAYRVWMDEKCFTPDPKDAGDPYCIVIPPPNVTGALHLGHAINNTLQDILIRMHRMMGFNTVWIPGIDHAGIATQAVVEKQLKEKENKTRHDVGREGLVERIWQWKQQYGDRILSQLQRLGCSCDWSRTRFTLDDMCAKAVRETFFKLFKDGLVYRGKRLVNWDTHLLTSISDDELYTETTKTSMWSIKYPIDGTDQFMTVATTRPETMLADTAVAVHPDDPRWNWAIGKQVRLPLTNRLIPIIGDPILVDMAFGSGVVKVTPAHDPNDYAVYSRHKGTATEIAILNLMTPDGKVNDADPSWTAYAGLTFKAARAKVLEDLAAGGFHNPETDVKPHEANVSFSDRSKTAIQPYLSDQWFVKMAPLAEPALEVVRDGTIKFFPERHAQQYLSWLGEKRDWPISRQLWWGHRIPVWSNPDGVEAGYHQTFGATPDGQRVAEHLGNLRKLDLAGRLSMSLKDDGDPTNVFICLRDENDSEVKKELEDWGWRQDPDVLDTWFSSALWPHSTLGWPEATADLAKWYPTSVLLTGRDIITLWVARMVMMGMYNMGMVRGDWSVTGSNSPASSRTNHQSPSNGVPFHHVAINPTILDGKGERMSKSKGNGVDPVDIIDGYGADALRFTLTTMATETQDARMPVKKDAQGRNTSEKFDSGRNFCNKLWNASRFVLTNLADCGLPASAGSLTLLDSWIISKFNKAVTEANEALIIYRFDVYAKVCYDFFWRDFCDWYVEAIKPAMKDPARSATTGQVLAAVLDGILRLMHPVIPFITETIWWKLSEVRPTRGIPGLLECPGGKRLIAADWPKVGSINEQAETEVAKLQELIVAIRTMRNDYKVDPKKPVTVSISADSTAKTLIDSNREALELLATCTVSKVELNLAAPENSARKIVGGCEIFVEGLVDPEAEKARASKRREELQKAIAALQSRMANESYMAKAPPKLVKETQDKLAEAQAELEKLS